MAFKAKQLEALILVGGEIMELSKSRRVQTEEGRAIMNVLVRLAEALTLGEPQTPPIKSSSHHA